MIKLELTILRVSSSSSFLIIAICYFVLSEKCEALLYRYFSNSTVATCPFVAYPTNAQNVFYSVYYAQPVYGDTMRISCLPGYKLIGQSQQVCTNQSVWSDGGSVAVTCESKISILNCVMKNK